LFGKDCPILCIENNNRVKITKFLKVRIASLVNSL
jgi:hypothetical protein